MALEGIFRLIEMDDGTALAGQPTEAQFGAVRDAGFQTVISLVPEEQDNALKGEGALMARLGMDYHYIPVPMTAPATHHLAAFEAAMLASAGRKRFIHCAANMRVTVFYSLYAMKHLGWDADRADALIARMWDVETQLRGPWRALLDEGRAAIGAPTADERG